MTLPVSCTMLMTYILLAVLGSGSLIRPSRTRRVKLILSVMPTVPYGTIAVLFECCTVDR